MHPLFVETARCMTVLAFLIKQWIVLIPSILRNDVVQRTGRSCVGMEIILQVRRGPGFTQSVHVMYADLKILHMSSGSLCWYRFWSRLLENQQKNWQVSHFCAMRGTPYPCLLCSQLLCAYSFQILVKDLIPSVYSGIIAMYKNVMAVAVYGTSFSMS